MAVDYMRPNLRVSRYLLIKRLCKSRAYPKRKLSVLCAYNAHGDCDCQKYRQFMLAFMMRFIA